jgi:hypothetical protein
VCCVRICSDSALATSEQFRRFSDGISNYQQLGSDQASIHN